MSLWWPFLFKSPQWAARWKVQVEVHCGWSVWNGGRPVWLQVLKGRLWMCWVWTLLIGHAELWEYEEESHNYASEKNSSQKKKDVWRLGGQHFFFFFKCVCIHVFGGQRTFQESVPSFYPVGPRDWTQTIEVGSNLPFLLSHLPGWRLTFLTHEEKANRDWCNRSGTKFSPIGPGLDRVRGNLKVPPR